MLHGMGNNIPSGRTVWEALDSWAATLKPWQRRVLELAVKKGSLASDDIDEVCQLFLESCDLAPKQDRSAVATAITGRPIEALTAPLRLDRIDQLSGINALPDGSSLTFGPQLTVIYGRNGAGKSGFGRLCANACFSRNKPTILSNIYAEKRGKLVGATFHYAIGGQVQQPFKFTPGQENADLKRVSIFDTVVAHERVSQTAPFEFKPSGFDVFPEIARVYGELVTASNGQSKIILTRQTSPTRSSGRRQLFPV
jgi:hypothetical protein